MAKGGLGTVFVELSLDDKVYKQKLGETLTSTTATAKGIEKSWQVLGTKSDAVYQAQARSYQNALTLIKNSATSTQADILRAERATAEKIKAIHERQYGHQTTIIEGLKKNWIAASVAIGAAMVAVSKAWGLADQAAKFEQQKIAFNNLAASYNTSADQIIASLKRTSGETIATQILIEKAGTAMMMGINPEKISKLMEIARATSKMTGQSITEAFDNISLAVGRQSKMILDNLGIIVSAGDANEQYAKELGKSAEQLTDTERKTAFLNATISAGEDLMRRMGSQTDTTRDQMDRFRAQVEDTKIAIGQGLVWAAQKAYGVLQWLASGALNVAGGVAWMAQKVAEFDAWVASKTASKEYAAERKRFAEEAASTTRALFGAAGELADKAVKNLSTAKDTVVAVKRAVKNITGGESEASGSSTKGAKEAARDAAREAERLAREQERARKEAERAAEKAEKDRLDALHEQAEAQMKLNADMIAGAEKYRDLMAQMNIDMADGHEQAIMRIMEDDRKMYENITKLMDDGVISFDEAMKAWEKLAEKTGKSIEDIFKEDLIKATETFKDQLRDLSSGFYMLSNACLDMAASYEEGSSAARHWEEAAKAFEIAQRAVAVVSAVAAVASAAEAPPPAGFVAMAAMLASMTSLLATIGLSVGGGSSSSASVKSTSTALGSEEASNSVENSFKLLEDIYDIENTKLTKIYNEIKDLNSNITGLVTTIFRTGGISAEGMGISSGTAIGGAEKLLSSYIYQDLGIISKIGNFLNQPVLDIANFIFGGKVKTKVTGTGIAFDSQSIADILAGGMDASQYADIKTTKSGWFGSKKTSYSTQYQALDSEVSAMFDKVFQGMGQSLVYFAENLGTSVNDVLNYTFEQTKIDLKDMTAEEMNTAIQEYISSVGDNAVSALFGDMISRYQKLEEGLMETATRLIIDKEVVASVLEDTGKAFKGSVPQMIAFSEQLIEIAGSLENLTDVAQQYIDKFYTDAEKFASTRDSIRDVAGILPRTRDEYRKFVESIDLTSEVGKQAYYTLMALSDTADSYYSHLEEIASQRYDMEIELMEAQGKAEEALAASRRRELEAMDESLRPLQELIWLTQDLGTSLETITTQTSTAINELISTSSSAASKARSMANTYKGLIDTLTEAQIKIFGGGKAGAQTRLNDIYSKAMTGDAEALGKMPEAIDNLLSESLATAKTSLEYRRDQAKSYIALENAKNVSTAMVNWEEYQATLLETQTKLLEEMRDELAEPSPDLIELQKHADLLGNIATLLQQQTAQVVQGNTYVHDQTGKIIAGNALLQQQTAQVVQGNTYVHDQTGKIIAGNALSEKQTAQIITGNAVQDVIKNLDAENTSYTSEMLSALVNDGSTQSSSLLSILSSSTTIVSLLGQLITVFEDNEKNVSLKEIELSKSEYTKAWADVTETNKALQAAIIATDNAKAVEQQKIAAYGQAADVSSWAASVYNQNPTEANKALYLEKYAAANTAWDAYSAAAANYKTAVAQQEALQTLASQQYTTAMQLKSVTNKLIDAYNAEYPDDKISKLPSTGWKYGGIASGSESGYEATLHGTELIVSPKGSYPATVKGDSGTVAEIKSLRQDVQILTSILKTQTKKTADILDKFDRQGLPAERAA